MISFPKCYNLYYRTTYCTKYFINCTIDTDLHLRLFLIMSKLPDKGKIIIEGITKEGEKFRPRDWALRMSDRLATYSNRRLKYSPLLQPSENKAGGYKCVLLDPKLKITNPDLYNYILEFAKKNNLNICNEKE